MTSEKSSQSMKPATAAKKLGIYLPAAPQEFQDNPVSRAEFNELQSNPPAWLSELRRNGPHPRPEVARKLNVSIGGLARGGVSEALTTAEITELLQNPPEWLVAERATQAAVRAEAKRLRDKDKAAKKTAR
ncbi:DUF5997 family protein [Arthrobacter sp. I2-34]|uniref:DUF5997 family protein n=1 Tax=Arthrobacter hankyongi TaxID=2904801 RepID=A0ABS9LA93_9MICC|nr:DUF5997 family protein [Arthrobacter hankyongi]MCG2623590.1 DUF5997 family protein [Arthrobacter hankyongi]